MIEFKHVFVQYVNEFFSLYDFNCEINSHTLFVGDFFSGTNAIMRTVSKIDKDYKGDIFIDDINLKNIKDKDLNLSYLPETPVLFKNKNIFDNLYFPLKIRKINKNNAKNLIFSIFFELKNNNFEIFNECLDIKNYDLNKENILKNEDHRDYLIESILKLKVKKLSLSEQKILSLIRAILRKPKFVLIENFFENLNEKHIQLAEFLLNKIKETSTIIACEKEVKHLFKNFQINNSTK